MDHEKPQLNNDKRTELYPWQVQGVVWLLKMLNSLLKCGILADDVGLGTTIIALVSLYVGLFTALNKLTYKDPTKWPIGDLALLGPYNPTVILCPPNAL